MEQAQSAHVKTMAREIRKHAEEIVSEMDALEEEDLEDTLAEYAKDCFEESLGHSNSILQVYNVMLPNLPE